MTKAAFLALLKLAQTLIDLIVSHKKEQSKEKFEDKIDEIQNDPVAHARNKFGRVSDDKSAAPVRSDTPKQP